MTRSPCTVCGRIFASIAAFDMHRTGKFEQSFRQRYRRCLTEAEMRKHGMTPNNKGWWSTSQNASRIASQLPLWAKSRKTTA